MKIRDAVPGDAATIAQVHLASWKTTYPGIVPQAYIDGLRWEDGAARWAAQLTEKANTVLVVEDDAGVFGFVAGGGIMHPVEGYDGELGAIYLLASHQGKGAGAALVRRLAGELRGQGFRNMAVWALKENPACGFYQRMGGAQVAEQMIEIGGVTLPELAFGWPDIDVLCEDEK
ncbi:MAG TPA: GNAT family N-acetyltransferase [Acidobacteriaceae bacterium]|nr:GNAT family N-acetyltransferase [Acidobacteriaceae bacterium]